MHVHAVALAAVALVAQTASVDLSSHAAGARPVVVTLKLHYPMTCGYPGPGPVVVRFPAGERVPARIVSKDVLVDGKPARALTVSGRTVAVALPPPPQVLCQSIAEGTLTIRFTRAARFGNPPRPGRYLVAATRREHRFAAPFTIS